MAGERRGRVARMLVAPMLVALVVVSLACSNEVAPSPPAASTTVVGTTPPPTPAPLPASGSTRPPRPLPTTGTVAPPASSAASTAAAQGLGLSPSEIDCVRARAADATSSALTHDLVATMLSCGARPSLTATLLRAIRQATSLDPSAAACVTQQIDRLDDDRFASLFTADSTTASALATSVHDACGVTLPDQASPGGPAG